MRIISIVAAVGVSLLATGTAQASNCTGYTYAFGNGGTADGDHVMADLNMIMACANNNLAPVASPTLVNTTAGATVILAQGNTNGFTLLADKYSGAASQANLGVLYSSAALALGWTVKPNGSAPGGYVSSQGVYASYPAAIEIGGGSSGLALGVLGNSTFAVRTTGTAVTMNYVLQISTNGQTTLAALAGSGSRTITADSSGTLSASSDERLKDIVGPYSDGLSAITVITPIVYTWKPKSGLFVDRPVIGFSAQNVQHAIPAAVGIGANGFLTLDDRGVLATSVNALKELKALSDKQASQLAVLTARLARDERELLLLRARYQTARR